MKKCSRCKELKSKNGFYKMKQSSDGIRPECIECHKKGREKFKEENPVKHKANLMASGILSRTVTHVDTVNNRVYKNNKVISKIGDNRVTISKYLYDNYYEEIKGYLDKGVTPSVDRIDPKGNYSEDNIQIIPLEDNLKKGRINAVRKTSKKVEVTYPDGEKKIYPSVSEVSRVINKKRDTIIGHRDRGTSTRDGYRFKHIEY